MNILKTYLATGQAWEHHRRIHELYIEFIGDFSEGTFNPDSYFGNTKATESFSRYREHREDMERFRASRQ